MRKKRDQPDPLELIRQRVLGVWDVVSTHGRVELGMVRIMPGGHAVWHPDVRSDAPVPASDDDSYRGQWQVVPSQISGMLGSLVLNFGPNDPERWASMGLVFREIPEESSFQLVDLRLRPGRGFMFHRRTA